MMYDPEKVTFFAKTDARGQNIPFGIKAKDRQRHLYVIGKTGMGKSTMLENMAIQDIQNGEGIAFIDPHGSAAETLLNYVPADRVDDVLYFAPFDTDYPIAFNIMEDVEPDKRHLVVSGLMSVFEKIWADQWSSRMAYILQNTLMALLEYPDSTLLGVNKMLSDKKYRENVVANITDPGVRSFWVDEFAKYTDRFAAEATPAIQNKIGQFTSNPVIRNIVGQPKSSFSIREIMDDQKILIMNLSKGLIGESNANLLGSMLTTRIYLAAMSRADLSAQQMQSAPNFYFFVDEFQSFANSTFANILSEARKYKLNLTIAHQYIQQMEEEVRDAVFGNVGTIVSFRVGPFDAEVLETMFAPQFYGTDIVNLGFAQVYLTLMIDGIGSQPFSAKTMEPIEPQAISYKEMAVAASRKKYANERALVEKDVQRFHEPIAAPPRSGDARRGQQNAGRGPERRADERRRRDMPLRDGSQDRRRPPQTSDRRSSPPPSEGRSQYTTQRNATDRRPSEGSGEHRSRRERGERKNPDRDLGELRSILKNISGQGTQGESEVPQVKKADVPKKRDEKTHANRDELKQVLKGTIPHTKKSESEITQGTQKEVPSVQREGAHAPSSEVQSSQTSEPVAETQPQSEIQHVSTPAPQKQSENPQTSTPIPQKQPEIPPTSTPAPETRAPQQSEVSKRDRDIEDMRLHIDQRLRQFSREQHDVMQQVTRAAEGTIATQSDTGDVKKVEEPKGKDISPKELERMMRVHTNDKSPIR